MPKSRSMVSMTVGISALVAGGLAITAFAPSGTATGNTTGKHSASAGAAAGDASGDVNPIATREEVEALTSEWSGERFPDGRPKVSDKTLKSLRSVTIDEAWEYLDGKGYKNQFAGRWKMVNDTTLVGRALTAQFMPNSPALEKRMTEAGNAAGHEGKMNTWPIDLLQGGDVYVADGFEKADGGTLIGGTLASEIYEKSHNGVVFDGTVRDLEELEAIKGFNAYVRDWHPSYLENVMLTGLNTTTRIGEAVVLPGDVVLAKREGVVFIPAQLADDLAKNAN